jgi:anti-sigma factor RsiW
MTDPSTHYTEALQDLLDGRLSEPLRSQVAGHVSQCRRCARELEALRWVKSEASKHVAEAAVPPELAARVRAALDAEDGAATVPSTKPVTRRVWLVGSIAAALLLVVFLRGQRSPPITELVAADYVAYRAGSTALDIESVDPAAVEAHFAQGGIRFRTSVYDLGMMGYQLAGGRVHRLGRRASALFAYRGAADAALVCQMYEGNVSELPPTDDVRQNDGITFYVHRSAGVTMVFWQEGDVVCVLTSDGSIDELVQLAFAKAVRVETGGTRG